MICPANGESSSFANIKSAQRATKTVDRKSSFISDDLEIFKFRATVGKFQAIILDEGPAHEARGYIAFIAGVNVFSFAEVDDDRLPSVGKAQGLGLTIAQFRPSAFAGASLFIFKIGELDPVKSEIRLLPFSAPLLDEQRE